MAGGFASGSCGGGNGGEEDVVLLIGLAQIKLTLVHGGEELDALGHIHGAAAAHGQNGVTACVQELLHARRHILVEGIRGEAAETDGCQFPDSVRNAQLIHGAAADQHDLPASQRLGQLLQIQKLLHIIPRGSG